MTFHVGCLYYARDRIYFHPHGLFISNGLSWRYWWTGRCFLIISPDYISQKHQFIWYIIWLYIYITWDQLVIMCGVKSTYCKSVMQNSVKWFCYLCKNFANPLHHIIYYCMYVLIFMLSFSLASYLKNIHIRWHI